MKQSILPVAIWIFVVIIIALAMESYADNSVRVKTKYGNLYPRTDNTYYIGNATNAWADASFKSASDVLYTIGDLHENLLNIQDDISLKPYTISNSIIGGVWTYTLTNADGFRFDIDLNIYVNEETTMSVDIESYAGTNANPKTIYIYVAPSYVGSTTATLYASNTNPDAAGLEVVDVAQIRAGAVSDTGVTVYASYSSLLSNYELINHVYHRFYKEGALYEEGLTPSATISAATIASGTMQVIFDAIGISSQTTDVDSMFWIASDATYVTGTTFTFDDEYSTGEAISANKYFNVVLGIVPVNDSEERIIALVQRGDIISEYISAKSALEDAYSATVYQPSDSILKYLFIPVMRVVVKNTGTGVLQEIPSGSGKYYIDIRNQAVGGGAGSDITVNSPFTSDGTNIRQDNTTLGLILNQKVTVPTALMTTLNVQTANVTEGLTVSGGFIGNNEMTINSDAITSRGLNINGTEGGRAEIYLNADQGDDNGDSWYIANYASNLLDFQNDISGSYVSKFKVNTSGDGTFSGGLAVSGNTYITQTSGNPFLQIKDNTAGWNPGVQLYSGATNHWTMLHVGSSSNVWQLQYNDAVQLQVDTSGNLYGIADASFLTFTDRTVDSLLTPYEAAQAILKVKGKDGEIDHNTLPQEAHKIVDVTEYYFDIEIAGATVEIIKGRYSPEIVDVTKIIPAVEYTAEEALVANYSIVQTTKISKIKTLPAQLTKAGTIISPTRIVYATESVVNGKKLKPGIQFVDGKFIKPAKIEKIGTKDKRLEQIAKKYGVKVADVKIVNCTEVKKERRRDLGMMISIQTKALQYTLDRIAKLELALSKAGIKVE